MDAFGDIKERKKIILRDMANIDVCKQEGNLSLELLVLRAWKKGDLKDLLLKEEVYWRQKARVR